MGTMAYKIGTPRPIGNLRSYLRGRIERQRGLRTEGQSGFSHRLKLELLDTGLNFIGRLDLAYLSILKNYCALTGRPDEFSRLPLESLRIWLGQKRERMKTIGPDRKPLDESPALKVLYVNPKGRITSAKTALLKWLGYDETEMVGRSFKQFVHPDDFPILREGRVFFDFRMKMKGGEYINIRAMKRVLAGTEDDAWLLFYHRGHAGHKDKILRINLEDYRRVLAADPQKIPLRKNGQDLAKMVGEVIALLSDEFAGAGLKLVAKIGNRRVPVQADELIFQSALFDILMRVLENAHLQQASFKSEAAGLKIVVRQKSLMKRAAVSITGPESLLLWASREGDTTPFSETRSIEEAGTSKLGLARRVVEAHAGNLKVMQDIFDQTVILISLPLLGINIKTA